MRSATSPLWGQNLDMQTPDITSMNIENIAKLFPNVITEKEENGKINKAIDFDLLKQQLSKELVEEGEERYTLNWPGKKASLLKANTPIEKTLRPCREDSVDFDKTENLYLEGDNFEVLKILQESYLGKVKMIYIDPPYNTGKDFVYKDNFKVSKENYEEELGLEDEEGGKLFKNTDTNGRFHSDWLSMMYERLTVARDLLKDDGVIFMSIDDNEVHNLRKIADEIFGEENFVADLIWNKQHSQQQGVFKNYHEYLLIYSKNELSNIKGGEGEIIAGALKKVSKANPASNFTFPKGTRVECSSDFEIKNKSYGDSEKVEIIEGNFIVKNNRLVENITLNAGWTQKKQMLSWFNGELTIDTKGQEVLEFYFNSTGKIKCKKNRTRITPSTILPLFGMSSVQSGELKKLMGYNIFDNPKPIEMIKLFSKWFLENNDIILDFFSGSATTAHAVMKLNTEDGGNRKFVMVQLQEETDEKSEAFKAGYKNICEIGKERIIRAGKKIIEENKEELEKRETPLDTGFRVYKTDSSNMKDVFYHPSELEQGNLLDVISNIKEDRSSEDLLTQVILDLGLTLDMPIEKKEILGNTVYFVAGNSLVACFDENIDFGIVDEIAKEEPLRVVFRDSCFQSDSDRINFENRFKKLSGESDIRVI